jgi:pyridoxamine 5'-phosphate oxidase
MTLAWLDPAAVPETLFAAWLEAAVAAEINDPNAMSLATVGEDGIPNIRIVLLKGFDQDGFSFFTNYESRKGQELLNQPRAGLCFHWKSLRRQVRATGTVERVSAAASDAYFATRPRRSQIGAWASIQSSPLADRAEFEKRLAEFNARYPDTVPRPPHWGGFVLRPKTIEFWQELEFRLHDRVLFKRDADGSWYGERLYP